MAKISFIIPIYVLDCSTHDAAKECLLSIRKHCPESEIIVINNSNSAGENIFRSLCDIYVPLQKNIGYGPAINLGFKLAHREYICAMNDDVEIKEGFSNILRAFDNPLCGVVRPGEVHEKGEGIVEDYTWYHGFCWIIKRELWQSIKDKNANLLDENFVIGNFEDLDLWQRILSRNLKLFKDFETKVIHCGGLTIKQLDHVWQNKENEKYFIEKHDMPNWREIYYP